MEDIKTFLSDSSVKKATAGKMMSVARNWYTCIQKKNVIENKKDQWECIRGTYIIENTDNNYKDNTVNYNIKLVSMCSYVPSALERKVFEMKNKNHTLYNFTEFA